MQTSLIPATTCEAIDKKIRDFIWGSSDQGRKIHLVNWDRICSPKSEGGLGLRLASHLNRAYMTKLAYLFFTNEEALWVKIIQSKYFKVGREGLAQRKPSSKSAIWRGISREWPTMTQGARSLIHDGVNTAFWTGRWVDSGVRLIDFANTDDPGFNIDDSVADLVDAKGAWDFQKIRPLLQPEGLNMVAGTSPPVAGSGEDDWCWGGEPNGKFSINSTYEMLRTSSSSPDALWEKIWCWKGPARVNHFLWLAAQDKLLTNCQRVKRKLTADARCTLCQANNEDVTHILRDCQFAKEVWVKSGIQAIHDRCWQLQGQEWLRAGITSTESTRFGLTCWVLWKARNERIFSNAKATPSNVNFQIAGWSRIVKSAVQREQIMTDPRRLQADRHIAWEPGPESWMVINSDGSVLQPSGHAGAGGLIRNEFGHCLAAYSMNLGRCSITRAELRGALYGLQKAWELGFRKVLVFMDSTAAIDIFQTKDNIHHQHAAEARCFHELQARDWEVQLRHTYREANKAADHLANRGHSLPLGDYPVPTSDTELGYFLRYDCYGISELRSIVVND
ncbi:Putative ribonuclease H protein At1g65750 [Linum perenne]